MTETLGDNSLAQTGCLKSLQLWLCMVGPVWQLVLHTTLSVCVVTSSQDILWRKSWLWGKGIYSGQFVDDALLLQDLKLQKGYFLFIVCLIQVIQRLQFLQRRMRADLLLLQHTHREKWPQHQPVVQKTESHVMRTHLRANHLKVLLRQAFEFLLHLLDSLSQLIIPFIQQFVLVQQGFTLLLWLSNTLQLLRRRGDAQFNLKAKYLNINYDERTHSATPAHSSHPPEASSGLLICVWLSWVQRCAVGFSSGPGTYKGTQYFRLSLVH